MAHDSEGRQVCHIVTYLIWEQSTPSHMKAHGTPWCELDIIIHLRTLGRVPLGTLCRARRAILWNITLTWDVPAIIHYVLSQSFGIPALSIVPVSADPVTMFFALVDTFTARKFHSSSTSNQQHV